MNECEARVSDARGWHYHKCGKTAKVTVDGKHYCGIHDPERWQRIRDANAAKKEKCQLCHINKPMRHYKYCPHCGTKY